MYAIKQDTGFIPYYLTGWDGQTDTFGPRMDYALRFSTLSRAMDVAKAITKKWARSPIHPLKVVPIEKSEAQSDRRASELGPSLRLTGRDRR